MSDLRLSGLPELKFGNPTVRGDNVFFGQQEQLMEVLSQGNPVYLVLDLPCMRTPVIVGFPVPGLVRVYANQVHPSTLVGQAGNDHSAYPRPSATVKYRFGMRLTPWMFSPFLNREHQNRLDIDSVLNYPVLSHPAGYSGALIRVLRFANRSLIGNEWMEIYFFSTGNEYHFNTGWDTNPSTRLIARFRPATTPQGILWQPEMLTAAA